VNTEAAIAMRQATAAIPIVAAAVTDPVAFGLVASHARPGANVTGILATLDTLPEKQLTLAAAVIGRAGKMGMLIYAGFQAHTLLRQGDERAAAALAIALVPAEVRLPDDLDAAFHSLARERVETNCHAGDGSAAAVDVWLPRVCRSRRSDELRAR